MSEDNDDDDKPLDASDKRLNEARDKGNQPFAREAPVVAMLLALTIGLGAMLVPLTIHMADDLALVFAKAGEIGLNNSSDFLRLAKHVMRNLGSNLAPVLMLFMIAGILASVLQNPPQILIDRIAPKWNRLSPMAGFTRIFGSAGLIEFLKAIGKVALIGTAIASILFGARHDVAGMLMASPIGSLSQMHEIIFSVVKTVLGAAVLLLIADLFWSRHQWAGKLKMNHQEMKDEMKDSDGDPAVKAKRMAKQRQLINRMMADVPKATMIITNPTHYAVALKYEAGGAGVPQVVAKGAGEVALRIKALAVEHKVPMVEDVPLARALHKSVEVGQYIPREFFQAIAEIVHIITNRKGGFGPVIHKRTGTL
jgi:flagellar biosynthesis protein FlhB